MQDISCFKLFTWWASLVANSNNSGLKHQSYVPHTWRTTSLRIELSWCPLNSQRWDNLRHLLSEGYLSISSISRRTATAFKFSFVQICLLSFPCDTSVICQFFARRKQRWYEVNLHFSTENCWNSGERIF